MSRLLKHIQVIKTPELVPEPLTMVLVKETSDTFQYGSVYRVEARLGAEIRVSDEVLENSNITVENILRHKIYRPLAEEVFGEYRKPLIDAILAIHQGDSRKAINLVDSVLDSMFKIE